MAPREPLWLGTGLSYSPEEDRLLLSSLLGHRRATFTPTSTLANKPGHGVVRLTDLLVAEDGTPGMRVKVAAGSAFIAGSESAEQGTYAVRNDADLVVNLAASDATLRRNDIIVGRVRDADYSGATRSFAIEVVQGATYAGAHNDANDPALSANSLALARVQVAAADTAITNAEITSLRKIAPMGGRRRGTAAERLLALDLEEGEDWYETDGDRLLAYTGAVWRVHSINKVPISGTHATTFTSVNSTSGTVSFGVTFVAAPIVVATCQIGANNDVLVNWASAPTTTGVAFRCFQKDGTVIASATATIYWVAYGELAS